MSDTENNHAPYTNGRSMKENLLEHIRELADELGKTPSQNDVQERGKYGSRAWQACFDTWTEAVEAAGLEPNSYGLDRIPSDDLMEAMQDLAVELGYSPSMNEMNRLGEYSYGTYYSRFESWNEALEAAGLTPNKKGDESIPNEKLLGELRRLADELGKTPTTVDMQERGQYSTTPYYDRFESWDAALEAAGVMSIDTDD